MSVDLDSPEHEQSTEELIAENTRWLKVIAHILADMHNQNKDEIYEDLE